MENPKSFTNAPHVEIDKARCKEYEIWFYFSLSCKHASAS